MTFSPGLGNLKSDMYERQNDLKGISRSLRHSFTCIRLLGSGTWNNSQSKNFSSTFAISLEVLLNSQRGQIVNDLTLANHKLPLEWTNLEGTSLLLSRSLSVTQLLAVIVYCTCL